MMHSYKNFVKGTHTLTVDARSTGRSARKEIFKTSTATVEGQQTKSFYEEIVGLKKTPEQLKNVNILCEGTIKGGKLRENHQEKQNKSLTGKSSSGPSGIEQKKATAKKSQSVASFGLRMDKKERLNNKYLRCAQEGDFEGLQSHIQSSDIDINVSDVYGWTALMCASRGGHAQIVEFLLECGADVSCTDTKGKDAAQLANTSQVIQLFSRHRKGLSFSSEANEASAQPFYCNICKTEFSDTTPNAHQTSTIHLFNCRIKPKPTHYFLPSSNKGFQMMLRNGWQPEKGLGSEGQGQKFPVKTVLKRDRQGLGVEKGPRAKVTHFGPKDTASVETVVKTERKMRASTLSKKAQGKKLSKERRKERDFRLEFYTE